MSLTPLPKHPTLSPATTEDCKALLSELSEDAYPTASSAGRWTRISKRGSGALIERVFSHDSGLLALLIQTPSELRVERLGASAEELATPSSTIPSLEARAPQSGMDQARAIMGSFFNSAPDEDSEGPDVDDAWTRARELLNAASIAPIGSPLGLAVGNLLEFSLPGEGWDGAFIISFINNWIPGDQAQGLEDFFDDVVESPNDSTEHLIDLPPEEAIVFLLERGVRLSSENVYRPGEVADPQYAAVMSAIQEQSFLSGSLPPGSPSASKPL